MTGHGTNGPASRLRRYLDTPDASIRVGRYLTDGAYAGAHFEDYAAERSAPDQITSDDLIAVTMLSIPITLGTQSGIRPGHALALEEHAQAVATLLRDLPDDRDLHDLSREEAAVLLDESEDSAAWRLHRYLRDQIGLPRVASYKLASRKRPRLLPVRDGVVENALGMSVETAWSSLWWDALSGNPWLVDRLYEIHAEIEPGNQVSLLRIADICVWMAVKDAGSSSSA